MGLRSANQAEGIDRGRTEPDLQIRPVLTSSRPNADRIADEGHIVGKEPDQ
jgi:hypothetical protein